MTLTQEEQLARLRGIPTSEIVVGGPTAILAYGPGGSGKTRFLRSMPMPQFHYCFDDGGADVLAGIDGIETKYFLDDSVKTAFAYNSWCTHWDDAEKYNFWEQFRGGTVSFDSVSGFEQIIHNGLRKAKPSAKGDKTTLPDYNTITINTWDAINQLIRIRHKYGVYVVVMAHETHMKEEYTGKIKTKPLMYGQSDNKIFGIFSEAYHFTTDGEGLSLKYQIAILKHGGADAKSRMDKDSKLLQPFEDPDFSKILEKIRKGGK